MRTQIEAMDINGAIVSIQKHCADVLNKKGHGSFASVHEAYGIMEDERSELLAAIQSKAPRSQIRHELLDQAHICVFAIACLDAGTMDW